MRLEKKCTGSTCFYLVTIGRFPRKPLDVSQSSLSSDFPQMVMQMKHVDADKSVKLDMKRLTKAHETSICIDMGKSCYKKTDVIGEMRQNERKWRKHRHQLL